MNVEHAWQREASRLTQKINIAWWLQILNPLLVLSAIIGACAVLYLRYEEITLSKPTGSAITTTAILTVCSIAWLLARKSFQSLENSFVRLDDKLQLNNALSSAKEGIGEWPNLPKILNHGYSWNWTRLLLPIGIALACLLASFFIPISSKSEQQSATQQPRSWEQLENDLKVLEEEGIVEKNYIEETKKKLEELQKQKEEKWFNHSSLEATDSLKGSHQQEVQRNERDLRRSLKSLQELEKTTASQKAKRERLINQLQQSTNSLNNGAMKPNAELLQQLQQAGAMENLEGLSKEQMEQLKQNLQNAADSMSQQMGGSQNGGEGDWIDQLMQEGGEGNCQGQCNGDGDCQGCGEGKDGQDGAGKGGINRGPGSSPKVLGKESKDFKADRLQGIQSRDLSKTLPGDLLDIQDTEHEKNELGLKIRQGGTVQSKGDGGDRVWKDSLLPDEQKALKKFFE